MNREEFLVPAVRGFVLTIALPEGGGTRPYMGIIIEIQVSCRTNLTQKRKDGRNNLFRREKSNIGNCTGEGWP